MLCRDRLNSPNPFITAGMTCLVIAIAAQRFLHPPSDFWQGFIAGLSGGLVGMSIVFNIRGLWLYRNQQ